VRTTGKYGFMAAVSSASDMPASCAYSDCAAALVARGRSGGHGRQSAAEGRAQAQAGRVRRAEEPGSQANQTSGQDQQPTSHCLKPSRWLVSRATDGICGMGQGGNSRVARYIAMA
jgi:hypothetical protein